MMWLEESNAEQANTRKKVRNDPAATAVVDAVVRQFREKARRRSNKHDARSRLARQRREAADLPITLADALVPGQLATIHIDGLASALVTIRQQRGGYSISPALKAWQVEKQLRTYRRRASSACTAYRWRVCESLDASGDSAGT